MTNSRQTPRTFILVGHCRPDAYMLRTAIERSVPQADITEANTDSAIDDLNADGNALLINRILDGRFRDPSGIALIRRLAAGTNPPPMVLISNFADAQQQAVEAGASPGFGKSDLYGDDTMHTLQALAGLNDHMTSD